MFRLDQQGTRVSCAAFKVVILGARLIMVRKSDPKTKDEFQSIPLLWGRVRDSLFEFLANVRVCLFPKTIRSTPAPSGTAA